MKVTNIYISCFLILFSLALSAQQDPNYTFYRYNMNLVNPAYAGSNEVTNIGLNARSQWESVKGAPESQSLIFGTPIGKNVGLGISVVNDKTFVEKQTSLALDFSYRLQLNEGSNLYFGLKSGFNSYDANTAGLTTYGIQSDPSLMNIDGRFSVNFGIGAYLKNDNYFITLSIPKILTPDRLEYDDGMARLGMDKMHMYLAGGYNIQMGNDMILKPSVLLRYVNASPLSVDVTAILEFNQRFDFGAAYRLDEGISGILIFKASSSLEVGYAYELAMESRISNIDNGTHEVMMNLKL